MNSKKFNNEKIALLEHSNKNKTITTSIKYSIVASTLNKLR